MPDYQLFPIAFWLVVIAIPAFAIYSWRQPESALRLPMLMVLGTVSLWYVGDVLYNDYAGYLMEIDRNSLSNAWWEVLLFVCAFGLVTPRIHRAINKKYLGKPSNVLSLIIYGGLKSVRFQNQLDLIARFLFAAWVGMMTIALFRTSFDFQGLFMPYLGEKVDPWERGRLGAGFDSLLALASYFQIALAAAFGVIMAFSYRPVTFFLAVLVSFLTLPGYIFDRTRSAILATLLPGFLAWVFLRLRFHFLIKVAILIIGFLAIQGWFKFVIENRAGISIAAAFHSGINLSTEAGETGRHAGLNMFEELGFINTFIASGTYRPNWGERYLAEFANPIPRALWPNKPMIGIDYAVARGQKFDDAATSDAGVGATISTGMIGQGVVNFGRILGPVAAALLMALWVAILARQDLLAMETGRLFLYAIGLILTVNMGRDITLLVTYPFWFAYLLVLVTKHWAVPDGAPVKRKAKSIAPVASSAPVTQDTSR